MPLFADRIVFINCIFLSVPFSVDLYRVRMLFPTLPVIGSHVVIVLTLGNSRICISPSQHGSINRGSHLSI